jgi:very-short-patch-repair endonuclease
MGPYVVDFACHRAKLIIELDGSRHADTRNVLRDEKRTAFLEAQGYRVIRFWNAGILYEGNPLGQIDEILKAWTPRP